MRGKPALCLFFVFLLLCSIVTLTWPDTPPEAKMVHGSLDTFRGEGIVLAWGILKNSQGKGPEADRVVIRIHALSKESEALQIEGIDPFAGTRSPLYSALFPEIPLDLSLPRSHFDTFPRTEIHFFRSYTDLLENKPQWILYFVGVPDTTPEFLSADRLKEHLEKVSSTPPR